MKVNVHRTYISIYQSRYENSPSWPRLQANGLFANGSWFRNAANNNDKKSTSQSGTRGLGTQKNNTCKQNPRWWHSTHLKNICQIGSFSSEVTHGLVKLQDNWISIPTWNLGEMVEKTNYRFPFNVVTTCFPSQKTSSAQWMSNQRHAIRICLLYNLGWTCLQWHESHEIKSHYQT